MASKKTAPPRLSRAFRRLSDILGRKDVSAGNLSTIVATPPRFHQLERQARHLQKFLVLLLTGIVLLSTSVFLFLELGRLRTDARDAARDCARHITYDVSKRGFDSERLSELLRIEMENHAIAHIRILRPDGDEVLSLGQSTHSRLPNSETVRITSLPAPFEELQVVVEVDERSLPQRLARVLFIHILVGTVLAVLTYRFPLLAIRKSINELESAEAQLMHAERLSAIGEMYASLTHEINNPLGIILTRVKIMLSKAREHKPRRELVRDLEMIDRHGTRIAEIIRGLLAFARKTPFQPVETDLNSIIQEVVALVEKPYAKQGIQIQCALEPTLPRFHASPLHIQQVFMNLLKNARDAMPEGGLVSLRTSRNGRYLVAEVEDAGPGIAPEIQGRLFEPFFTTKEVGKGTGLGLSVSYGIVSAHRGHILVESDPGRGALFRVMLPIEGAPS